MTLPADCMTALHERAAHRALARAASNLRDALDRLDRAALATTGDRRDRMNEAAKNAGMVGEAVEAIRQGLERPAAR